MTPGARVAAAIDILQDMAEGQAAEKALTRWARRSRFAGSKDRAAVRDHVFDVVRKRRLAEHFGQGDSPRNLMIGLLHAQDVELDALFDGAGHAPSPLNEDEANFPTPPQDNAVIWSVPDWQVPLFEQSLGPAAGPTALALQDRAPVYLRVNIAKADRNQAVDLLSDQGVTAVANPLCDTALTVTDGARKLRGSDAYLNGFVELQDAASQAVVAALPTGRRVLDYCAGGGGKGLAIAAQAGRDVFAHDSDAGRMANLPERAARAGAEIPRFSAERLDQAGKFDVVLCDAPCSGSGAWRRAPEGKWTLTPDRLQELTAVQDSILDAAVARVGSGGTLVYATCSVFLVENEARIDAFLERHPAWHCSFSRRFDVGPDGDGFYTAHLMRADITL